MLNSFINRILKDIPEENNLCIIANDGYKKYFNLQMNIKTQHKLFELDIENMNFIELKKFIDTLGENLIIIILMPFFVPETSNEEVFNWLMKLEEQNIYFINIFVGMETIKMSSKGQENYNKLFNKIITSDEKEILYISKIYKERIKPDKAIRMTDSNGTDFIFKMQYVYEEKLPLNKENRVIQIPYGEVFGIPYMGSVNGRIILEWKGEKREVKVLNDFVDLTFIKENLILPICEVGVGTNPYIPRIKGLPFYEKRYNTYHIGVGNNFNFGGGYRYNTHFDLVVDNCEWELSD